MSEHFSAHLPSHADVDMSGEYYDEEYTMQDATEATNDEEIYDAEIDEQIGQTEVEMDEYTDEVADDEAHMGSYVPPDDATVTDVTVEDVQFRSSPVISATPREVPALPISPHVALDADLPINEAPTDALATHSPHSVATLVDDSETVPYGDGSKQDLLNEVIDLTANDNQPQTLSTNPVDPANPEPEPEPQLEPEHESEAPQNNLDVNEQELYEGDDLPPIADDSTGQQTIPDQSPDEQEDEDATTNADVYEDASDTVNHPNVPEQSNQSIHSPIEEALVINQQVRDDAADSMEPSPPVRLLYKDEAEGIDKVFDIFASSDSGSSDVQLLFDDNRTLFYEPLSSFFVRLRETDYFSGDEWRNVEIGLKMDLGSMDLSINEDHKETESVSLFKLSFVWSGLGLEGPLQLSLCRYSEKFSVQFSRLVEQVEQRDNEGDELNEVRHEDFETGVENEVGDEVDTPQVAGEDKLGHEDEESVHDEAPTQPQLIHSSGGSEDTDRPHQAHEGSGTHIEERQGTNVVEGQEGTALGVELGPSEPPADDEGTLGQDREPSPTSHLLAEAQNEAEDATAVSDSSDGDKTAKDNLSPRSSTHLSRETDYTEYDADGVQDLAPNSHESTGQWGDDAENEYDEYEDYENAEDEPGNPLLTASATNESRPDDAKSVMSAPDTRANEPAQNFGLKRNIDELEYEEYDAPPSAPSSPASDHKRVKHVAY